MSINKILFLIIATKDLMTLLVKKGMNKPPSMIYQFDNCGENKVKINHINLFLKRLIDFFLLIFRTKKCLDSVAYK
jgi:hypothetical protein